MTDGETGCVRFGHDRFSSVRSALREDIRRFSTFDPDYRPGSSLRTRIGILLQSPLLCLCCYRIAHWLWVRNWRSAARALAGLNFLLHRAHIPADSCIGPGCFLGHTVGTTFIASAGRDLTLFGLAVCCPTDDALGEAAARGPRLGDGVTIGGHGVVIGRVSLGDGARVAPKTRLGVDCPAHTDVLSARLRHNVSEEPPRRA